MKLVEPISQRMKLFLDYAARKQRVISSNLANVETPGYRAKELTFTDVLKQEVGSPSVVKRTDERHLAGKPVLVRPFEVEQSAGDTLGYDGNNVDLEKEMTDLAQNVLEFSVVSRMIQLRGQTVRSAVKEGKG